MSVKPNQKEQNKSVKIVKVKRVIKTIVNRTIPVGCNCDTDLDSYVDDCGIELSHIKTIQNCHCKSQRRKKSRLRRPSVIQGYPLIAIIPCEISVAS